MKLPVHFIFLPTKSLLQAAADAGELGLAKASVWTTHETDRTGLDHSQAVLEQAFWTDFQANLIYDNETEGQRIFRTFCLKQDFSGCWTVIQTGAGGPAEDLLAKGQEATEFLNGRTSSASGAA